jgi:WD40 repeat protein
MKTTGVITLFIILAACAAPGSPAPPASAFPLVNAVAPDQFTDTPLPKTPTNTPETPKATAILPAVTPSGTFGPLIAALGDPVPIGRGGIRDAAFSPDFKKLVIGWTNGASLRRVKDQVDLWDWQSPEMVTAVDVSEEYVAILLVSGDVWLLDIENGKGKQFPAAASIPGGDAFWGDVAWAPDGSLAAIQAVGGLDTDATPILLLDPLREEINLLPGSLTSPGWEPYLTWSPDSRMVTSANQERNGWVLDSTRGEVVFQAQPDSQGRASRIYAWVPNSTIAIYGSDGGSALLTVDVSTGEIISKLTGIKIGFIPTPPVIISSNANLALVGGYSLGDYQIFPYQIWDLKANRLLDLPLVGELRHINSAGAMQLSRPAVAFDGNEVLYLDTDGRVVRWNIGEEQGNILSQVAVHYPSLETPMLWSEDSTRLVLETDPGKVISVWEVASGNLLVERVDGTFPADLHNDLLAYRGENGDLIIWSLLKAVEINRLPGPVTLFKLGVKFSPDGKQIAYGVGKHVFIRDVASGEMRTTLDAYPDGQEIMYISWSPEGDALIVASGNPYGSQEPPGTLILWEKSNQTFVEAFRTQNVQASLDPPRANLGLFSPTSRFVALFQMPENVHGQEAVLVYDRQSHRLILEKKQVIMHLWSSTDEILLSEGCRFIQVNVLTGEENLGSDEGCQAELGAFAPDGIHYSSIVFSGRSVEILDWRTGLTETSRYVGSDLQDGIFSPDGHWLLVRAIEGLVRVFPVSLIQAEDE